MGPRTSGSSTSPPTTGSYTVETCTPAGFAAAGLGDTLLSVLRRQRLPPVTSLGCNDDSCGLLSKVTACFTAGAPYYIRVAGYSGAYRELLRQDHRGRAGHAAE